MAVAIPGLYYGTQFAALDGKGRVAVPGAMRASLPLSDDGSRILWVTSHEKLPCLIAFGVDYMANIPNEVAHDEDRAAARGVDFDRNEATKNRVMFAEPYVLDGSGRFVMSGSHKLLSKARKQVAFVGAGLRFEIWALEELVDCDAANPKLREMARAMLDKDGAP